MLSLPPKTKSFVSTNKKLPENGNWDLPVVHNFTQKQKFVSNILSMIVEIKKTLHFMIQKIFCWPFNVWCPQNGQKRCKILLQDFIDMFGHFLDTFMFDHILSHFPFWTTWKHHENVFRGYVHYGYPVDTGRKLTFRRCPGRLLNVICTFNLRPVSTGIVETFWLVETFL